MFMDLERARVSSVGRDDTYANAVKFIALARARLVKIVDPVLRAKRAKELDELEAKLNEE